MVTGADPIELHRFFKRCSSYLPQQIQTKTIENENNIN